MIAYGPSRNPEPWWVRAAHLLLIGAFLLALAFLLAVLVGSYL